MESNLDTKPVISQNDYNKTLLAIKKGLKHPKFGPSFSSFSKTPQLVYIIYIHIYIYIYIYITFLPFCFQSPIVFGAPADPTKIPSHPKVGGLEGTLRRFGQGLGVFSFMGKVLGLTSPQCHLLPPPGNGCFRK